MLAILLKETTEGFSEHELLRLLQQPPHEFFATDALRDPLILFQSHFLLFHCLYLLQNIWLKDQCAQLEISALKIKRHPFQHNTHLSSTSRQGNILSADPLAQYYLDWSHFSSTSSADVDELLNSFWKKVFIPQPHIDIQQALAIMELKCPVPLQQLKVQYRRLAQLYHPDKGGDSEHFKQVCQAFHQLKRYSTQSS